MLCELPNVLILQNFFQIIGHRKLGRSFVFIIFKTCHVCGLWSKIRPKLPDIAPVFSAAVVETYLHCLLEIIQLKYVNIDT